MTLKRLLGSAGLPRIVAHRGASGHAPENTLPAFSLALQMGAEDIELDIQMSRDGVPVVFHDARVDRTTDRKGAIGNFIARELRSMDAGTWFNLAFPEKARPEYAGSGVPTLQDTLDLVQSSPAGLYLELKDPELQPPDFESRVLALIRQNHFEERVIVCSFSRNALKKIRSLDPAIEIAVLANNIPKRLIPFACSLSSGMLSLRHDLITRAFAARAHQKKLSIAAWTVNDEERMRCLVGFGVHAIITNYPDRLVRLLGKVHAGANILQQ